MEPAAKPGSILVCLRVRDKRKGVNMKFLVLGL